MTRNSIVLLTLASLVILGGLAALIAVLVPIPERPLQLHQNRSLGLQFDPHLSLAVEAARLVGSGRSQRVVVDLRARNNAAGDLDLDLSRVRVALDSRGTRLSLDQSTPAPLPWQNVDGAPLPNTVLPARDEAVATASLPTVGLRPNGIDSNTISGLGVVLWEENTIVRWLPFARRGFLNPRLRYDLDELPPGKAPGK